MQLKIKRIKELFAYFFESVKKDGFVKTGLKVVQFFRMRIRKSGRYLPSKTEQERQRAEHLQGVCLSIVTPLFNTPDIFLKAFIDSVIGQTYENWQLCLADASDMSDANVQKIVQSYQDARIVYEKLPVNEGISANTNAAAKLATGEYLCFADHDDILSPNALYEIAKAIKETSAKFVYSDEALFESNIKRPRVGHFKPDYSPDYLRACNYIGHIVGVQTELFWQVGGLQPRMDGSQDHDLNLRICEATDAVYHIPKVLYYWRVHEQSTSGGAGAKPYVIEAGIRAVQEHIERIGRTGVVERGAFDSTYRVRYAVQGEPLVSILIPNKDHTDDLEKLLSSLYEKTTYRFFEVIVIENNSEHKETFAYYEEAKQKYANLQVVHYEGGFNFSAINNFGRRFAKGDYLLLLNNDTEVITPEWLYDMVGYCQWEEVGIVGAKLLYSDDTVQHAGIIVGLGGYAGHNHKYFENGKSGYMFRLAVAQNLSGVTAACLLVKTCVFDEVNGMDEDFTVAYNDVDFCLRVRAKGYLVVFTPYAELYHYESKSRGLDTKGDARKRFDSEKELMKARYGRKLLEDPYYSPNLTLDMENFAENPVFPKA